MEEVGKSKEKLMSRELLTDILGNLMGNQSISALS